MAGRIGAPPDCSWPRTALLLCPPARGPLAPPRTVPIDQEGHEMRSLRAALAALSLGLGLSLFVAPLAWGEQILQYGFEARGPVWKAGSTDAAVKVLAHELTGETAHGGLKSEHLRLQVERGTFIHYVY